MLDQKRTNRKMGPLGMRETERERERKDGVEKGDGRRGGEWKKWVAFVKRREVKWRRKIQVRV